MGVATITGKSTPGATVIFDPRISGSEFTTVYSKADALGVFKVELEALDFGIPVLVTTNDGKNSQVLNVWVVPGEHRLDALERTVETFHVNAPHQETPGWQSPIILSLGDPIPNNLVSGAIVVRVS